MYATELKLWLPEIIIASMACIILLLDVYLKQYWQKLAYYTTQLTLLVATLSHLPLLKMKRVMLFERAVIFDQMGVVLKLALITITAVVLAYSKRYLKIRSLLSGEFLVLLLCSLLGMMVLVSAGNFLTLYLGLELLALPLYTLVAMNQQQWSSQEAAMKYFITGAIASGLLLFGISLLYGVSGSLEFKAISIEFSHQVYFIKLALQFGVVFIVTGIAFKLGVVPFHMWIPDVYQGSATPITLIISSTSKIAAFGMIYRVVTEVFHPINADWQLLFTGMGILSLLIGNIVAIAQSNLKRLLAYSTIAHMGYVMLGLVAGPSQGFSGSLFYLLTYVLTSIGTLGMILVLSRKGFEGDEIRDFRGLWVRNPGLAFIMMVLLFSLAGVPPTVGFYAKFMVIKALVGAGYVQLAVVAILFSVIAAFYYLRLIRVMFFDKPHPESHIVSLDGISQIGMTLIGMNGLVLLFLGIYPAPIWTLCKMAFQ